MPEGPLGGPRPLAEPKAELNIYFTMNNLAPITVEQVRDADIRHIEGEVTGVHGTKQNVVSAGLRGNSITMSVMENIKREVESATDLKVSNIEVIF